MHYAHSHVITIRPPARTRAWSLAALARRIPEAVHGERELRAGFEGIELWIKELADPCESRQAFESLAHSPTLLNWHRDNARKVVQQALMRDLRAFHAVHLGAELAGAVLPPCEAVNEQAAVRVRHVRELAGLLVRASELIAQQDLRGDAALQEVLRLRRAGGAVPIQASVPAKAASAAQEDEAAPATDTADEDDALVQCASFPVACTSREAAGSPLR